MRRILKAFLFLAFIAVGRAPGQQEPPAAPKAPAQTAAASLFATPGVPDVVPGGAARIPGENFPTQGPPAKVEVLIRTGKPDEPARPPVAAAVLDAKTLTFTVPKELPPGRYLLDVVIGGEKRPVAGEMRVVGNAVTVYPTRPRLRNGRLELEISAENLALTPAGTAVEVVGRGSVAARACADDKDPGPCLQAMDSTGRKLKVIGFPTPADGETQVQIRVRAGDLVTQPATVTFGWVSGGFLRVLSVGVFLVLLGGIALLTGRGLRKAAEPGQSRWDVLFLDKETNSYSLSKFQMLWWIALTGLGYVYLFLCRALVQGYFNELPPVPQGLPMLLGLSVGTTVAVAGATAARGNKGAGALQPTAADFISAGGLVNGERFQFFLWTIIAGLGFLAALAMTDPTQVQKLPDIPDTLLYLTGVSAAGYVGGRLVRKPGPVIKNLAVTAVSGDRMEFDLPGDNLSKKSTVKIDDNPLRADVVQLVAVPDGPEEFSTRLKLTLTKEAEPYREGSHTLTLVNPDGQSASAKFPMDPMTIDTVTPGTPWIVTGKNFADPTTVENGTVKRMDATKLEVTLQTAPPPKSEFTLRLLSPAGLRASKKVAIP